MDSARLLNPGAIKLGSAPPRNGDAVHAPVDAAAWAKAAALQGLRARIVVISRIMNPEKNFGSFWPEYVRAHSRPGTRAIHLTGTLAGWALLAAAVALERWWWIALALFVSYALAWISHFFVEHNRPATFEHPLWSWWADQKMVAMILMGKMGEEVRRCTALH